VSAPTDAHLPGTRGCRPSHIGLKLSGEYEWLKRSFDGIHVGYLVPIKRNAPDEYKRILERFPFVEAEVWRHERAGLV